MESTSRHAPRPVTSGAVLALQTVRLESKPADDDWPQNRTAFRRNTDGGFTLIEMLITIALMGVVLRRWRR